MDALQQKIVGFETWHLALPVSSTRDHGVGRVAGSCEIIVLALTLEDGTTGWGEASPWVVFTGSPEASHAALARYIKPHVVGRMLSEHADIMADADRAVAHCTEAKAALDTALFDLTGQVLGVPVHALLSDRHVAQTEPGLAAHAMALPLSVSLANPEWAADVALLERLRSDGVRIVKLKTGFRDHPFDLMRLEALRQDFPEFAVRVDYNQGLRNDEAEARVRDVASFVPDFIEQPVRAACFAQMAHLRTLTSVLLLADESVFGPVDMARACREGICDGVSIKIMKSGGLGTAQQVAALAQQAGLLAYGGDMFEAGIAHLAGAHMVAATPEITLGCEFYQAKYYLVEDILETPIEYSDGRIHVPAAPGLGRRPDRAKLESFRA
ncbi:MAG: enolase C-terminal domain-like protein [Pseudomonadota bacterium]